MGRSCGAAPRARCLPAFPSSGSLTTETAIQTHPPHPEREPDRRAQTSTWAQAREPTEDAEGQLTAPSCLGRCHTSRMRLGVRARWVFEEFESEGTRGEASGGVSGVPEA
ncbi:hypothetical protein WOLCODRAFT_159007 [Wolfiporia cocos MD-104 SS10]|uniref:Uncharacterized protein n=1 Tax=Wolfiporia cocos (strain MD-104) TaxID=742152 RepID=A0A2H3JNZ2_WOLCO|nr:hypothetical protein WOLCODRAFT_159007 [Wolfiporia cocos MD-104 SS10]